MSEPHADSTSGSFPAVVAQDIDGSEGLHPRGSIGLRGGNPLRAPIDALVNGVPTKKGMAQPIEPEGGTSVGEPQFEHPSGNPFAGSLDNITQRTVFGWLADKTDLTRRIDVEILVDGNPVVSNSADEYRSDLLDAGIGDGYFAFAVELPRALFDGEHHDVAIRPAGTLAIFHKIEHVLFDAAYGAEIIGQLVALRGSAIVGHVANRWNTDEILQVALMADGVELAQTSANLNFSDLDGGAAGHWFAFDLSKIDVSRLISGPLEVIATTDQVSLGKWHDFGRKFSALEATRQADSILVSITMSYLSSLPVLFDILLDGVVQSRASSLGGDGGKTLTLRLPLGLDAKRDHTVSVFYSGTSTEIFNSPCILRHNARRNLVGNSQFSSWTGQGPDGWHVVKAPDVCVEKSYMSDSPAEQVGPTVLSLWAEGDCADRMVVLSQDLSLDDFEGDKLDVIVCGRAASKTRIGVRLFSGSTEAPEFDYRQDVVIWPQWGLRSCRIERLARTLPKSATLELTIDIADRHFAHIGLVAAGSPGFALDEDMHPPVDSRLSNAVINGDFEEWSTRLRNTAAERRTALADGWTLTCKQKNVGVAAGLVELFTRAPNLGYQGEKAYGVSISGRIAGSYLRLETELDKLQLMAAPPNQLAFYARRAAKSAGQAAIDRTARARIEEIFIIDRQITADGAFQDKKLLSCRRRIAVPEFGEYVSIHIQAKDAALLYKFAGQYARDPARQLVLVFEFTDFVDIALTDVRFGRDDRARNDDHVPAGYIAIEDPNIAIQASRLKGFEHWLAPTPWRAPDDAGHAHPVEALPLRPKWSWQKDASGSVDIVICVYNAIEDTLNCLRSVERCTDIPHTVTIVDDGSSMATRERLRHYALGRPWIRIIELPANLGYTKAANVGLSSSTADWVVLLNSDTIVTPNWLKGLLEVAEARPDAAMIGPVSNAATWQSVPDLYDVTGKWKINAIPEGLTIDELADLVASLSERRFPTVPLLNGFCTMMKRSAVETAGFLDEIAFPIGYGEENDLCVRIRKAGHSLCVADHVYVYHVKSASFGSKKRLELSKRGTEQFMAKHPDVDLKEEQRIYAETHALIEIRNAVKDALNQRSSWQPRARKAGR